MPAPGAAPGTTPRVPVAPAASNLSWHFVANPMLLFRYSALTFNGHRIHYDLLYVTDEEGNAGLVVHGPIHATLLLNMAARLGGRPPERFGLPRAVAHDRAPDLLRA